LKIRVSILLTIITSLNYCSYRTDVGLLQGNDLSAYFYFQILLSEYYVKNERFPTTFEGLSSLNSILKEKPIPSSEENRKKYSSVSELNSDIWGNPYIYISEDAKSYKIISFGKDGKKGGGGLAKDYIIIEKNSFTQKFNSFLVVFLPFLVVLLSLYLLRKSKSKA